MIAMEDEFDEFSHYFPTLSCRRWQKHCNHPSLSVDEKQRQISCDICGAVVDAFDYMSKLAKEQDRFRLNRKALHDEILRLSKQVDGLKREEKNAKNRLATLEKKGA
jgi:uncharacterized Zn finger protein (UPF0148 family)